MADSPSYIITRHTISRRTLRTLRSRLGLAADASDEAIKTSLRAYLQAHGDDAVRRLVAPILPREAH